jgi:hypothetical protein
MPDLDLFAAAYETGQQLGRVFRWLILLAVGFKLVQRIVRNSWSPGFLNSPLVTVVGLVAVVAGLIASVQYDFGDRETRAAGPAAPSMASVRANIVQGCRSQGEKATVCGCYADEVLRRTGNDPQRFAALEREFARRQEAGQTPPAAIVDSAQACVGRG